MFTGVFSGIRSKLLFLVFLVFIPALALNLYFTWALRNSEKAEAMAQALRTVRMVTENQREEIEGTRQLLITLSKISRLRSGDYSRCESLLNEIVNDTENRYINILLIDRMGTVVCRARSQTYNNDFSYHSLVGKVTQLRNLAARKFPVDDSEKNFGIIFAYPIMNFSGKISGAIAAIIDERWIERLESDIPLPKGAFLTILDDMGASLPSHDSRLGHRNFLPRSDILMDVIKKGQSIFEAAGRDGEERIYAISPVAKSSQRLFWCIGLSTKSLFFDAERFFILALLVLLGSAVVVLLGAWVISNRTILVPLQALVHATRQLAQGHLNVRVGTIAKGGELSDLGKAFDRMGSSLQQREASLERSRKRLADILSMVYDPIISLDEQFRIRFFNPSAQKVFGYTIDQVLGKNISTLMSPLFSERILDQLKAFSQSDQVALRFESDLLCVRNNGHDFPVEINISKLKLNTEVLYTLILRDITERQKAIEAQKRWSAELQRSNAELEHFAYNVSHDLQEPLRMIASYTRLLQQEYSSHLDLRANEFLGFAVGGSQRLQKMVRDLLIYARVGRPGARITKINCPILLEQIVQDLSGLIQASQGEITVAPLPDVFANETELRQIFQNLIINALKFKGEDLPRIHIGYEETETHWLFWVKDNGIGIEPEFQDRIFGLFQRLHAEDEVEGTGIGLALCRKITESFGGKIWVESKVNEGACFFFTIAKEMLDSNWTIENNEIISY